MADQLDLFGTPKPPEPSFPAGFKFQPELITPEAERTLLAAIRELPFKAFELHGYVGKRRTISFGASYDFANERLQSAPPLPAFLLALRETAAAFAALPPESLQQVLVTEYGAGSGIGWHRDKAVFENIVGLSLLSSCPFRLRRQRGGKWERFTVEATPRSAYLLSGAVRAEWEHSIPEVDTPRYSITYRSLRSHAP